MLPGIPYEFYASMSGLYPKDVFTLTQHQMGTFSGGPGYTQDGKGVEPYADLFFAANSGLTPVENYSTYQHAVAYFNKFNLPVNWVRELVINLGDSTHMGIVLQDTLDSLNDTAFGDFDALDYQSIYLQVSGTFSGTVAFQVSVDGVNWIAKTLVSSSAASPQSTTNAVGIWAGDIGARYFRVVMTPYTSGAATITLAFSSASQSNNVGTQQIAGTVTANPTQVEQVETSTSLAAGATYTGAARDMGTNVAQRRTLLRPVVMHNAGTNPGTLILEESTDNSIWRETRRSPIPSDGSYRTFEWPLHLRYYRLRFINGATAQTGFFLQTFATQGEGSTMDAQTNLSFLLSTAALAASATFTGPTIDLGDNHNWNIVRSRINLGTASSTVTVRIESSHDGTTWASSPASTATTTAAGILYLERPITERYLRIVVVNGATAQASNQISMALVSL